jgi:hypothetical protein
MEMQSVWQLLLEIAIYGNIPTAMQFFGMGVAITGSLVVAIDSPGENR